MRVVLILLFGIFTQTLWAVESDSNNNSSWNYSELNTASSASYLSTIEKEVVYEINLLRSNPANYAINFIEPLKKKYKGNILYYPGDDPLRTREGIRALNECIRTLKRAPKLPLVYPSFGLTRAAEDHVKDQSRTGRTGHRGGDRSDVKQRIERYGKWDIRIAENIAYGGFSARQVVIYLLIDDGVRDRGHRNTFLHPDFKKVGVAVGSHPSYKSMWVMDFAGSFTDN